MAAVLASYRVQENLPKHPKQSSYYVTIKSRDAICIVILFTGESYLYVSNVAYRPRSARLYCRALLRWFTVHVPKPRMVRVVVVSLFERRSQMSRTTNMQKVINSILFHSCLTKQEVVEVFNEIGSGDDTALSESMLEIDSRYSKSVSESEERLAKLEQEHEAKLLTHAKQHTEKLLAMEHQIATMVASRNVALKRTDDPEELEAIYAMYDPKIYKTKLERQEMVDNFKMLKDVLYREWQEKKRAELISQRESKISFDKERIKARRDYHEHKRQVVAKWLDVINEREAAKGGAA